jgi:hypothetical protein
MPSSIITALQDVRPGDLITSRYVNGLIAALKELDARIDRLERKQPSFRIDAAAIPDFVAGVRGGELIINVTGAGLDPDGLAKFRLNDQPFEPRGVRGGDDRIVIATEFDRRLFGHEFGREPGMDAVMLTLVNRAGAEASAPIDIQR